jgi:hypothetical protein
MPGAPSSFQAATRAQQQLPGDHARVQQDQIRIFRIQRGPLEDSRIGSYRGFVEALEVAGKTGVRLCIDYRGNRIRQAA